MSSFQIQKTIRSVDICDIMLDKVNAEQLFYILYSENDPKNGKIYGIKLYPISNDDGSVSYTI